MRPSVYEAERLAATLTMLALLVGESVLSPLSTDLMTTRDSRLE
jgi:hypothetical protein